MLFLIMYAISFLAVLTIFICETVLHEPQEEPDNLFL